MGRSNYKFNGCPKGPTERKHDSIWKKFLKGEIYPKVKVVKLVLDDGTVINGRYGVKS